MCELFAVSSDQPIRIRYELRAFARRGGGRFRNRDGWGIMFAQLWHVGRMSHSVFHAGALPVAPTALAPDEVLTACDLPQLSAGARWGWCKVNRTTATINPGSRRGDREETPL